MPSHLRSLFAAVRRGATAVGNTVSTLVLFIFYFSIFALFAVPYRLSRAFHRPGAGTFSEPRRRSWTRADFADEY